MKCLSIVVSALLFSLALSLPATAQVVLEDGGVAIDRIELEQIVERWTTQMRQAAADDEGDRLELLNRAMVGKRISREAEQLSPDTDPEIYWEYVMLMRSTQQRFLTEKFVQNLEVPDMSKLAREHYETEKDKYALVPEARRSSHILFKCTLGEACNRDELKATAGDLLAKLNAGADFEAMVKQYSQDTGTAARGGKLDRWIEKRTRNVAPPFIAALFEIDTVGGYSDIVETQFGVHILRLDEIREQRYLSFGEVQDKIVSDLEAEYRDLALKEYRSSFRISEDAFIDGRAMDEIFAPYKTGAVGE